MEALFTFGGIYVFVSPYEKTVHLKFLLSVSTS